MKKVLFFEFCANRLSKKVVYLSCVNQKTLIIPANKKLKEAAELYGTIG